MEAVFIMKLKIKIPLFKSDKESHKYIKNIVLDIAKQMNKHVLDLGDWPLVIKQSEEQKPGILSLNLKKALEPDEDPEAFKKIVVEIVTKQLNFELLDS